MSSVKQLILDAIHACADASGDDLIKLGLGTPGSFVQVNNTTERTGQAFEPLPRSMDCLVDGIAETMRGNVVEDGFTNNQGVTVPSGSMVYVSGDDQFRLASDITVGGLLGVTLESIANGATGLVAITGRATVRMVVGLAIAPVAGATLFLSSIPGELSTAGDPADSIGTIANASQYVGQSTVSAILRV